MNSVEYAYDHAVYVIDNLDKNSNSLIEFKTSVDISLFIAAGYETKDTIDEVMKVTLESLFLITSFLRPIHPKLFNTQIFGKLSNIKDLRF